MGYLKDTARGLTFQSILRFSIRLIGFVKIAIIARLLGPTEFGLFGIASLVLALLETMTDTGTSIFLIQQDDKYKKYLNSTYIISIIRGFVISGIIIFSIPFIQYYFNVRNVRNLLLLIALIPAMRGLVNPAIIKFEKDLRFDIELLLRVFLYSIDAIVSVLFALKHPVAMSLIVGMIVSVILEICVSWVLISPKPSFSFNFQEIKFIVRKGKWITLTGIFNYLFHNIDDVIVGKILGVYSLGLYQLSYKMATLPIYETGEIFGRVTLPVYTKIAKDKERLKKAFLKVTLIISLLVIPAGLILIIFTKEITLIFLGSKWLGAVLVIKILAVFGIFRAISGSVTPVFYAIKKQEDVTRFIVSGLIALLIFIFPLIKLYGLEGAAISTVVATIITFPFIWMSLKKYIL